MGVERREHSPSAGFLHLPPRMDGLKILWNPRMLLADLIVAGGLLAAWTVMKNAQDNTRQASPFVPRSQPVDVPPSFAPTEVNGENMVVAPATPTEWATWTPQPKATETPAAVATVTEQPTATAVATIEVPKKVYWKKEQIEAVQEKTARDGNPKLIITWPENVHVQPVNTYNKKTGLSFNGYSQNDVFKAPIGGDVISIDVIGAREAREVVATYQGLEFRYTFDWASETLIQKGDHFEAGDSLSRLSGRPLPKQLGLSKETQIALFARYPKASTNLDLSTEKNILTDENGLTVKLPP